MLDENLLQVYVWGKYACFARPDIKSERVTFEVPSAASCRGILEAILWKPQFSWFVREVEVLRPIELVRMSDEKFEEVFVRDSNALAHAGGAEMMTAGKNFRFQQRRPSILLKDVCYKITASIYQPKGFDSKNPPPKYREMFLSRLVKEKFHKRPCLGGKEFPAEFSAQLPEEFVTEHPEDRDFDALLLDVLYNNREKTPRFFQAVMKNGIIKYPQDELLRFWKDNISLL